MSESWGVGKMIAFWGSIVGVLFLITVVLMLVVPGYSRYQNRADNSQQRKQALLFAKNRVQVSNIEIRNQAQRVRIARQQADIRVQEAIGLRKAQDEIRKTLTPLYVQFELVQALEKVASSGRNDTVIYLPTNPANGLPVVPTSNTPASKASGP